MSRSLGPRLPDVARALLDGRDMESRVGLTILLLTIDEAGWSHIAMLSPGELLATDDRTVRAALWLNSTATRNLERTGRGVLALVADGAGYYIRSHSTRGADLDLGDDGRLAYFVLRVEEVLEDAVGYARLTSGITFELHEPRAVVARWQHALDALRAAAPVVG